jgi:crotonobetainyl-CoA:carnitine CoA-transferase CaiB-like acyl-CoA transferase
MRVVDLSRLIPGPWCSQILSGLGAEIVKVETPLAGDYARMAPAELGFGGIFEALNRGKKSVAVNHRLPRGRAIVLRLAASADVFLESSMPGQLARRGLGPADVRGVNPGLVYCSISGFGQTGPYRERPGHDLDYLAIGGLLTLLGPVGARPVPPGIQIADLAGGTSAALQVVAALLRRERTGEGATLDVAILDAVVAMLGPLGEAVDTAGGPDATPSALSGAFPCYGVYATADGEYLAVGALEPPFWFELCRGLGREDLIGRQYDPTAIPEVAAILATRSQADWLERLDEDACVAPVNEPREVELDRHLIARGLIVGEGDQARVGSPLSIPGAVGHLPPMAAGTGERGAASAAPVLGAHTYEILRDAGLAPDEIASLERDGIIAGPPTPEAEARRARMASMLARMADRGHAAGPG